MTTPDRRPSLRASIGGGSKGTDPKDDAPKGADLLAVRRASLKSVESKANAEISEEARRSSITRPNLAEMAVANASAESTEADSAAPAAAEETTAPAAAEETAAPAAAEETTALPLQKRRQPLPLQKRRQPLPLQKRRQPLPLQKRRRPCRCRNCGTRCSGGVSVEHEHIS